MMKNDRTQAISIFFIFQAKNNYFCKKNNKLSSMNCKFLRLQACNIQKKN